MVIAEIIGVAIFLGAFVLIWALMMGILKKCQCAETSRNRLRLPPDIHFYKIILIKQHNRLPKKEFKYSVLKDPEGRLYLGENQIKK